MRGVDAAWRLEGDPHTPAQPQGNKCTDTIRVEMGCHARISEAVGLEFEYPVNRLSALGMHI